MPKKFLTIQQALDFMEALDSDEFSDEGGIVCLPPDPGVVTDEENILENDLNEIIPLDVCGEVEVNVKERENRDFKKKQIKRRKRKAPIADVSDYSSEDDYANKCNPQEKKSKKKKYNWKEAKCMHQIESNEMLTLEEINPELSTKSPYELFQMYFDSEIMYILTTETLRYALQKNVNSFSLSETDIKRFLGIILFSGYHCLPQEDLYWSNAEDCNLPFIRAAMSRQRFRDIKKHLHLSNNNLSDKSDKLGKVRSFIEIFCKKLQQFGIFSESLSVDEQMIPYTGRHSAKMYMQGKPIKFGFKVWVLASSDGYPFNLQVYLGKEKNRENSLPLGTRVVLDLTECIEDHKKHKVYVDNFFNSLTLLDEMRFRNLRMTGTIRENRLQGCPLPESKILAKGDRGTSKSLITENITVVKWKDNKVVCLASNFEGTEPMGQAKRWSSTEKRKIDLPQPALVASYNKYMGGVDLLDRFLSSYRPRIRGKKWWWPFFANILNMAVVSAWKIHREMKGQMSQLEFLRSIVTALMKVEQPDNRLACLGPRTIIANDIRFDGVNHFILGSGKQSKCKICRKNTRMWCQKCEVMLHKQCALVFHKKL